MKPLLIQQGQLGATTPARSPVTTRFPIAPAFAPGGGQQKYVIVSSQPRSTMPASPFAISSQSSVFPTSTTNQAPTIVKLDSSSLIAGTTSSAAPAPKIVVVNMPTASALQTKPTDMGVRSMFEVGATKTEAQTDDSASGAGDGSDHKYMWIKTFSHKWHVTRLVANKCSFSHV